LDRLGIVLIGRNEGERLLRCLASVPPEFEPVVYVDSGSTDGSATAARAAGVDVLELAGDRPLSAARARNAGLLRLLELCSDLQFVQFVDGDCELCDGWLEAGAAALTEAPSLAVVCGHCNELHRDATIYNRLCDMEWDRRIGEIDETGGNFMGRIAALSAVGSFDESMIAGEEPDLCRRLSEAGWQIRRIDTPMVRHDAAMESFGQWWIRARRSGYVDAMGFARRGTASTRLRALLSTMFWVVALPLTVLTVTLGFVVQLGPIGLSTVVIVACAMYAALFLRIFTRQRRGGRSRQDAALCALFLLLAKLPQLQGAVVFLSRQISRSENRLIEYKSTTNG
jgi:glycosyltransferase involved in cell wall biosynthesis